MNLKKLTKIQLIEEISLLEKQISSLRQELTELKANQLKSTVSVRQKPESENSFAARMDAIRAAGQKLASKLGRSVSRGEVIAFMEQQA